LSRARVTANTDDGERGAGKTNEACNRTEDYAEQTSEYADGGVTGSLSRVAALEVTSIALTSRGRSWCIITRYGAGSSKDREDEEQESEDSGNASEHV